MKKLIKYASWLLSLAIFVYCIGNEIEGIGRFACIVMGTLFSILGCFL